MRIVFLLSFTLLSIAINSIGQSALPPVYEIKSDTIASEELDSTFWQKLEDKEGKWTLDEVSRQPLSGKFHWKGLKAESIDTNEIHTYWQRYRLKNIMTRDAKISLISAADHFDVYIIKQDSPVIHYRSGQMQKWETKDGLKSASNWSHPDLLVGALPLVLTPGEEITIYDRRNKKQETNFVTTIQILSTEKLIQEQYVDTVDSRVFTYAKWHVQEAFVIGLLFLSICISIFFYQVVKEKVYLSFALFALFLCINRHWNIAADYTLWFQPEWYGYVKYLSFAWSFIPLFLIQFIRHFFVVKQRHPKWDKFLLGAGLLNMIVGITVTIVYLLRSGNTNSTYQLPTQIGFVIIPLSLIITSLLYIRNTNRSYRYIAFGTLPLMLLYLLSNLFKSVNDFGGALLSLLTYLMQNFRLVEVISVCWLIVCFMKVLIMRFDKLRKENAQQALDKERLAKEKEIERHELIAKQKNELEIEVAERTADLKKSLEDLKSTQSQLIQSEKMASLGELTAGIAHEIQNPLNFVNNFSDVNSELVDEAALEMDKGNVDEVKAILKDIKDNEQKINHHGKRADAIVKGMLQHSRTSSGQKEPTNINTLADEYLRLAYHGLRAKDKSFNVITKTDFDSSVGKINIVPQEIGRVILNLINNAFYAVDEKKKQFGDGYEPNVSIITKKIDGKVEIKVSDNGNGIPQKVFDKIFQPFFTTKPTGQGTGLGLSLSYDIVKAHGGEIKVETKENEGTEFIIQLPVTSK